MAEIVRINMDKARFDPEAEFGSPEKLIASVAMTRGQKIASLQRWEMQVRDRVKVAGGASPTGRYDLGLLHEIERALTALKAG